MLNYELQYGLSFCVHGKTEQSLYGESSKKKKKI